MTTLTDAARIAAADRYLAVISTRRADGTIQSSLVNAGFMPDPDSGADAVAFVTYGRVKLANLRARPQLTVTFRAGWQWASVEGTARIVGLGDGDTGTTAPDAPVGERLRLLRREVFTAAGGTHDDWEEYDRVMAADGRVVVLVSPGRVYGNS